MGTLSGMPILLGVPLVSRYILALGMVPNGDSGRVHRLRIERWSNHPEQADRNRRVGLCGCGCGQQTNLAPQTSREKGWIRGQPKKFILGHANRTKQRPPIGEDDYIIENRGYETPCWIRRGFTTNKGYGRITIAGRSMYAHRAMYQQEIGPIPQGMTLDHLCRQPKCMRPSHLEPVPFAENLRRGNGAKLTKAQVLEIRAASASIRTDHLAEKHGISASQMSRVRRDLRWREISPSE